MNAPLHAPAATGEPLDVFSPAIADVIRLRLRQVTVNGHSAAADDAAGPRKLLDKAYNEMLHAKTTLGHGEVAPLPDMLARTRKDLLRAAAMTIATLDVIDRRLADQVDNQGDRRLADEVEGAGE